MRQSHGRSNMKEQRQSRTRTRTMTMALAAGFVALSTMSAEATTTPPKAIADKGTITYCMDVSFPPLESYDPQTNKPVGFDVDLGAALAIEMGVKSEFKNINFDG